MDRRTFLAAVVVGSGPPIGGCAGGDAGGSDYDVGMSAAAFEPAIVEVGVGETVVWRNTNSRAHTVTAYEATMPEGAEYFASGGYGSEQAAREAFWNEFGGAIASRDTYDHTFSVPGRYGYFCIPHERGGMVGEVRVGE